MPRVERPTGDLVLLGDNLEVLPRFADGCFQLVYADPPFNTGREVRRRTLAVVSDDGALIAAVDAALASQPDVLEKIRDGKVQAAGAIIGAVMKAMGGKADAARVRELVLERAHR